MRQIARNAARSLFRNGQQMLSRSDRRPNRATLHLKDEGGDMISVGEKKKKRLRSLFVPFPVSQLFSFRQQTPLLTISEPIDSLTGTQLFPKYALLRAPSKSTVRSGADVASLQNQQNRSRTAIDEGIDGAFRACRPTKPNRTRQIDAS